MMTNAKPKKLRWQRQVRVPAPTSSSSTRTPTPLPTSRERLIAALADRPRTVAQLAQAFDVSQPTVLDQVRRALRDGLIREVAVAKEERRYPAERYYATAVPVVRQPDGELLESACRGVADEVATILAKNWGDVHAAFALTHLAREGWAFSDLWPYLNDTIIRCVGERFADFGGASAAPAHGLAWIEDIREPEMDLALDEEKTA